ncbi:MAG: diaminobutyrate--2-oxoglutarate transaminase [Caenispirillum bisanense]|nr:diaminobutyrate--2-oxoglutarate transaminase [Caenispirillum bisanense]MCA1971706.1 diaminobutyrate--2-oxoglutarate transaminase [Caenispirillum sp.]
MTISRTPYGACAAPEGHSGHPATLRAVPAADEPATRIGDLVIRAARADDGAAMFELVKQTGSLDLNSAYCYLMMGQWFSDTCVVAERDGRVVGFVIGFVPPTQPDTIFVWQVGVAPSEKGRGVGKRLLDAFLECEGPEGRPRYLEATVTPSNTASEMLFRSVARRQGARLKISEIFPGEWFPGDEGSDHEPERLFRIGPLPAATAGDTKNSGRTDPMDVFETYESNVRSYVRDFPAVFVKAKGHTLTDENGRDYIDFFAGAGALNYGHNDESMKQALIEYLQSDGVMHSLDMATSAKGRFIQRFQDVILKPRGMTYKMMFPGPTGTNTVESALKLARKVKGREKIVSFTNAFHGMTLGSLAVTGNQFKRDGAGLPLNNTVFMPFDGYMGEGVDTLDYFEKTLEDSGSGFDLPAAVILETVQGEGGINAASMPWLKRLREICTRWDILMIVDDVQAGCGRTGTFFSFEPAGIDPDIVCLSKSLGGMGVPFAVTLVKPEYDVFGPGEHNGTFRGNNLAFVAAAEALRFWETDELAEDVREKAAIIKERFLRLRDRFPQLDGEVRGRGFMQGIALGAEGAAKEICAEAFKRGLIIETSGPSGEVVKILAPLTITRDGLAQGLDILEQAFATVAGKRGKTGSTDARSAA